MWGSGFRVTMQKVNLCALRASGDCADLLVQNGFRGLGFWRHFRETSFIDP